MLKGYLTLWIAKKKIKIISPSHDHLSYTSTNSHGV